MRLVMWLRKTPPDNCCRLRALRLFASSVSIEDGSMLRGTHLSSVPDEP